MISTKKLIYKIVQHLEGISTEISSAVASVTALDNRLSPRVTSLDSSVSSLNTSVTSLSSSVSGINTRVTSLEAYHNYSSSVGSNQYNGSILIYKQGNLVWVSYKAGPIAQGVNKGTAVALFGMSEGIRPYRETIVSGVISDGNYTPLATATIRAEPDGWVYLTSSTAVTNCYIMFSMIYIV